MDMGNLQKRTIFNLCSLLVFTELPLLEKKWKKTEVVCTTQLNKVK